MLQGRLGRGRESAATFRDAVQRAEEGYGVDNRLTARIRAIAAYNFALAGDLATAGPMMQRSLADLRAGGESSRTFLFDALRQHARMRLLAGDPGASLAAIDEADALLGLPGTSVPEARRLMLELVRAGAWSRTGRTGDARTAYASALERLAALPPDDYAVAEAHLALGVLTEPARCDEALRHLELGRAALARRPFVYAYLATLQSALADAVESRGCTAGT